MLRPLYRKTLLYLDASEPSLKSLEAAEYAIVYLENREVNEDVTDTVKEATAAEVTAAEATSADTEAQSTAPKPCGDAFSESSIGRTRIYYYSLTRYLGLDTSGVWLWSDELRAIMRKFKVWGTVAVGKQGAQTGQACWTDPTRLPSVTVEEENAVFRAFLLFNSKNGKKNAEFMAGPCDLDVHRPSVGSMAYVVRGRHRKQLLKIVEIVRDNKKVLTGFKGKRDPFVGRAPAIFVCVNEVTKVEELPDREIVEEPKVIERNDETTDPILFKLFYPDY